MTQSKCVSTHSLQTSDSDYDVLESFSDDEGAAVRNKELADGEHKELGTEEEQNDDRKSDTSSELKKLLRRREELERSNKMQEKRDERYQVSVKDSQWFDALVLKNNLMGMSGRKFC